MIEHALEYARVGWPIFRLAPGTKEPFPGSHGFLDATTDPDTIRKWWTDCPDANIGLATGAPGPTVVDIDDPDAGAGASRAASPRRRRCRSGSPL